MLELLPEALRTGRPYAMHEERRDERERWEAYIRGLFEISRAEQDANAALVPVERPRRMVDVAGGHGGFSMAMCRRHPELEATVLDLPPSAAVGRRIVAEQGFAERVDFREGDVFELGLGEELDVVSVFNLIHHLPEERNRELCRMARAALRPGGCLVIGDSARPEPGEQVSAARCDLEPALLRLVALAQLHARGGARLDARRGLPRSRAAPQRALALAGGPRRAMILLTGATGTVGSALLRRLTAEPRPVRCLVRDPRRLGDQRVRVQIALGDLADPASFRNALRGVDTVVHLAAAIRDQPRGVDRGAERDGHAAARAGGRARRRAALPVLLGDGRAATTRARASSARRRSPRRRSRRPPLETTVFCPSIVYAPGDPWLTLLERFSYLPAIPVSGSGRARYQPIWSEDVADCVVAALGADGTGRRGFELAGPETLSYDEIVRVVLRAAGRRRRLLHVPLPLVRESLRGPAGARRGRACSPPGRRRS